MDKVKALIYTLKRVPAKILGYFPSVLPTGMTEWKAWAKSAIDTYELDNLADQDSMQFVLSTVVINLDPQVAYLSKRYLANRLINAASKQVSSAVFYELKTKQQEAAKAAQAAEVTATTASTSNGSQAV